jgi:alpha-galactosidase
MIETWTELHNNEKNPVLLRRFDSGFLPVRLGNTWLSHLSGGGNNEGLLVQEPLTRGMKVIKNKDGNRNSQTAHA